MLGRALILVAAAGGLAACSKPASVGPHTGVAAPAAPPGPAQVGVASYFGDELAGRRTASGRPAEPDALTAAHRTLPLGAEAKVVNTENGRAVDVTVTDRGPYAKGRVVDVSEAAARRLGMSDDGVAKVKVQPLTPRERPGG